MPKDNDMQHTAHRPHDMPMPPLSPWSLRAWPPLLWQAGQSSGLRFQHLGTRVTLADGSVAKVGQFFTSYGPSGPDGLAMDESGRLLIANPGLGYVWVLNSRAEPEEVLTGPPGASITNLAFGGKDRRTLYCTDSTHGHILMAEMSVAGAVIHRPQ